MTWFAVSGSKLNTTIWPAGLQRELRIMNFQGMDVNFERLSTFCVTLITVFCFIFQGLFQFDAFLLAAVDK
jgi:hypothetical protein